MQYPFIKSITVSTTLILTLALTGCEDNPSSGSQIEEATAERQFVWNGLNEWYYWQGEVPDLADNRFGGDDQAFHTFLNSPPDEESLFYSLLHNDDDFSWFIDDYEEYEKSRLGVSKSFGYSFGLVECEPGQCSDLFGYVQYVVPGSPAEEAGLIRGDFFTRVDGTPITENNYFALLGNRESYTLGMADSENGVISDSEATVNMTAVEDLPENPIHLAKVLQAGTSKVGYLAYNAFRHNYHGELNSAFGMFSDEQIDELVIDLRYNGGGTLVTSAILAAMISGVEKNESNTFATLTYNEKKSDLNADLPFYDDVPLFSKETGEFEGEVEPMNQLSMNRVYFLTGRGTASASEALINGLRPFLGEENIILIGFWTTGKDEGSITLYDAPPDYRNKDGLNTAHVKAMQPIIFKLFNQNGEGYPDGFAPDDYVEEVEKEYLDNLPPLGDENEPLLAKALEYIAGEAPAARLLAREPAGVRMVMDSRDLQPLGKEMYLLPDDPGSPDF